MFIEPTITVGPFLDLMGTDGSAHENCVIKQIIYLFKEFSPASVEQLLKQDHLE